MEIQKIVNLFDMTLMIKTYQDFITKSELKFMINQKEIKC